jgi:hypothetical protein
MEAKGFYGFAGTRRNQTARLVRGCKERGRPAFYAWIPTEDDSMRRTSKIGWIACFLALGGCSGGFGASAPSPGEVSYAGSSVSTDSVSTGGSEAPQPPMMTSGGEAARVETVTTTTTTVSVETVTDIRIETTPDPEEQVDPALILTAASVGDADRRPNYLEFLSRQDYLARSMALDMSRRVRVRVTDQNGNPVNDAAIAIHGANAQVQGRTHADGVWDFYPGVSAVYQAGAASLTVTAGQESARTQIDVPAHGDGAEVVVRLGNVRSVTPRALDLAFLIDVTGSMEDELRYVNREVGDIVRRVRQEAPETQVRVSATLYRDRGDREVVQQIAFTPDLAGFSSALETVHASGGGDYPEDLNAGLDAAFNRLQWANGNAVRVLVLIADAPPKRYHDAQFTYHHALARAAESGIRIVPVAASGADRTVEFLFRAMGAFTSTPYVYLTDDSGVGNPHLEADTDRVAVEFFSDLLARLVVSDLRGHGMHEPGLFGGQQ